MTCLHLRDTAHAVPRTLLLLTDGAAGLIRLAIIGDVHGDWDNTKDEEALQSLGCDAAVFVGDINNGQPCLPFTHCFYQHLPPPNEWIPHVLDGASSCTASLQLLVNCQLNICVSLGEMH